MSESAQFPLLPTQTPVQPNTLPALDVLELAVTLTPDSNNPEVGDLFLTPQGTELLITDLGRAVAQRLTIRFNFFRGEWGLDLREGTPYYQTILKKAPSDRVIRSVFSQVILTTEGVVSIEQFAYAIDRVTRRLSLTFTAKLQNGETFRSTNYAPFIVVA